MTEELKRAAQAALEALKNVTDYDQINAARRALERALTQRPAAQATPEPLTLGPLAKRNIYDAIRGAYDLGYNDARNARTVPGDSAPGYDGRSVEEDHGGALFNTLSKRLTPATPEPVGEVVYIAKGHLREVLNGNTMNAYLSPEPDRFADVALSTRPAPGVPEGFALVPMTEDELNEMALQLGREMKGLRCWGWMDLVRAVERHHSKKLATAQAKGGDK